MSELILLKTYYHKHGAQMAVGLLQDAGIEAMLQSDDAGGFRHHLTLGMGNNRVMIQKKDAKKAVDVIENVQEELSVEEIKRIEEIAVQAKEPAPQKRKRTLKKNLSIAIPIIIGVVILLFYMFQEAHK